jgi:hypothetical protein
MLTGNGLNRYQAALTTTVVLAPMVASAALLAITFGVAGQPSQLSRSGGCHD